MHVLRCAAHAWRVTPELSTARTYDPCVLLWSKLIEWSGALNVRSRGGNDTERETLHVRLQWQDRGTDAGQEGGYTYISPLAIADLQRWDWLSHRNHWIGAITRPIKELCFADQQMGSSVIACLSWLRKIAGAQSTYCYTSYKYKFILKAIRSWSRQVLHSLIT